MNPENIDLLIEKQQEIASAAQEAVRDLLEVKRAIARVGNVTEQQRTAMLTDGAPLRTRVDTLTTEAREIQDATERIPRESELNEGR